MNRPNSTSFLTTLRFFSTILLIASLCSHLEASSEFEVVLKKQSPKKSISLFLDVKEHSFPSQYVEKISDVITSDLRFCRYFSLSEKNGELRLKATLQKGRISFSLQSKEGTLNLPVIALEGNLAKDRRELHKAIDHLHYRIFKEHSLSASRLLYSIQEKKGAENFTSQIYLSDFDGENSKQLTSDESYNICPCFIPGKNSSSHFLYVSYALGLPKIYTRSFYSQEKSPLLSLRGSQILPTISKDLRKIAFISDASGTPDLFLQHFDQEGVEIGRPIQLFSLPKATEASPTFNKEGSMVAFVSDKDGPPRIYVLPTTTQHQKRREPVLITKKYRENTCPAWSPDGTKLAYSAKIDGVRQICIYDFERSEEWQLTDGPEHKENPSFAPDSYHLVFNSESGLSSELYIINIEDKKPIRISKGSGQKRFPVWEPLN